MLIRFARLRTGVLKNAFPVRFPRLARRCGAGYLVCWEELSYRSPNIPNPENKLVGEKLLYQRYSEALFSYTFPYLLQFPRCIGEIMGLLRMSFLKVFGVERNLAANIHRKFLKPYIEVLPAIHSFPLVY